MKLIRNCKKSCNTLFRTDMKSLIIRAVCILIKFCIFVKNIFYFIFLYEIGLGVVRSFWRTTLPWHGICLIVLQETLSYSMFCVCYFWFLSNCPRLHWRLKGWSWGSFPLLFISFAINVYVHNEYLSFKLPLDTVYCPKLLNHEC